MKINKLCALMLSVVFFATQSNAVEVVTDDDLYQGLQRMILSESEECSDQEENALLDILKNQRTELKNQITAWCVQCKYAIHFGDCLALYKQRQFPDELQQKIALHVIMAKVENFFDLVNLKYDILDEASDDLMRLATLKLRAKKQQKSE